MNQDVQLQKEIYKRLQSVIDPETNADVIRMRLVDNLVVDSTGRVSYTFRPSSPFCPLAVHLVLDIREAVAGVPGVTEQEIEVVGYVDANGLNALLRERV